MLCPRSIYRWQKRVDAHKAGPKANRKISADALKRHIAAYPDAYLSERAEAFGVTPSGVWRAMQRLGITKKNVDVPGRRVYKTQDLSEIKKSL